MSNPAELIPLQRLDKIIAALEKMPTICTNGFHDIVDHMGGFSASFAASASRAATIQERHKVKGKSMGLTPLQQELTRVNREVESAISQLTDLVEKAQTFVKTAEDLILWSLTLEQDAFLPLMADQLHGQGGDALERQTQCAIIDSLMRQVRPLLQDLISSLREASTLMQQLVRKILADLDISRHRLKVLKSSIRTAMGRMTELIQEIDHACKKIEGHAESNNVVLFQMMQTMQYDDISSQRLTHMAQAMRLAKEKLQAAPDDPKGKCWFAMATRITIDQLEETIADLVAAVMGMHGHLTAISDLAESQRKTIFSARNVGTAFQQEMADAAYQLNAMLKLPILDDGLLGEILKTLSQTENTLFMAHKSMETLSKTTQRLGQLTNDLNTRGPGRLETLAESIRELARRVREEGAMRGEELLRAAESIQVINSEFSELGAPRIMNSGVMLRRIPLTIRRLEMSNADLGNVFSESLADTQATFNQIMLLTADIRFHNTLKGTTAHIVRDLHGIVGELTGKPTDALDMECGDMAGEFRELRAIYTMESERRIHSALLGTVAGEDEEAAQAEVEDDGFELF
ncbi:MAG: hypothetical protein HQL96_02195 [Magnetococcales bacterium]|nr:hypothetical protein [Magnetococcales bacterium]